MREQDKKLAADLDQALRAYTTRPLPGISTASKRESLVGQLVDSLRRNAMYIDALRRRGVNSVHADPTSAAFDPLKAAMYFQAQGNIDEAFWMVFLLTHFGKAKGSGWRLVRDIYGRLGDSDHWNWINTSTDPSQFKAWLTDNYTTLKNDGVMRRFGNHRKYETLKPTSSKSPGAVVESYVQWIGPTHSHENLIQEAISQVGSDPSEIFDHLFNSMNVLRFGRTGKFDYLAMLGKLGLAPIRPGFTYMDGATGPYDGACLLFGGSKSVGLNRADLDIWLIELDSELNVGMQVLEDAICNWQKSPSKYKAFHG